MVGKIPTPTGQVEQITLALIYKFMSDIDKENNDLFGGKSFFLKTAIKSIPNGTLWTRKFQPMKE